MIRSLRGLVPLSLPIALASAPAVSAELSEVQLRGRALFNQSCRVCHTPPALNAPLYGPALTQDTQRGKDDALTEIIRDGSPRMPGFKYQFSADQIGAIVAYLRTVPVPSQANSSQASSQQLPAAPPSRSERERQQREAD
jgi:mono/diheme cytochrome c family protein